MASSSPLPSKTRICLVSPGHLGSNPRLVKEARALSEAGWQVHVIHGVTNAGDKAGDESVLAEAHAWTHTEVHCIAGTNAYRLARLRQQMARLLFKLGVRLPSVAAAAQHVIASRLRRAALAQTADFYLGHCLASLPAVVAAARHHHAKAGFDAEDFHAGEAPDTVQGRLNNALAECIEDTFLPRLDHFTTSAPLIAAAYRQRTGLSPVTLLNVFPLSEATPPEPAPAIPSFYWFSQTIGPGRGLEAILDILRRVGRPVRLVLRGRITAVYSADLQAKAAASAVELLILAPEAPAQMVACASPHTAGLALEERTPLNRDLCLTNKAFTYLLAGVPVIFFYTKAQEVLARELGRAALLLDPAEPALAARQLVEWLDSSDTQQTARTTAVQIGRDRYNWDREKAILIERVGGALQEERNGPAPK